MYVSVIYRSSLLIYITVRLWSGLYPTICDFKFCSVRKKKNIQKRNTLKHCSPEDEGYILAEATKVYW